VLADVDTAYNRVWIHEGVQKSTGKAVRMFSINNENSSAMYLDDDELVHPYTKFYHLARHFDPGFQKTVMFGGAGYSFPKDFLGKYPEATMEVVEIDPGITELAKKYFRLRDNPRLTILHEDGRMFLNRSEKGYDVIFGDAFSSQFSIPYQLTTAEAVQRKYDILNDDGIVILNIISAIEGEK
jgi:spermidine synthase